MPLSDSLRPGLGNWVDGDRFFNRDAELTLFAQRLQDGESISLVAQRRIGKTSLMREVARRMGDRIIAVHADLERALRPEDAVIDIALGLQPHTPIWKRATDLILGAARGASDRLENIKLYEVSINLRSSISEADWKTKGDEIFSAIAAMAQQQGKIAVLFLDEVPILVSRLLMGNDGIIKPERIRETDLFMSWLRENVQRHKGRVAVVVTGSIGLEPLLGQAGLSGTMNAYRTIEIKPWRSEIAKKCILALAVDQELPLGDAEAQHMVARLGVAIPHHVQMFFDHVQNAHVLEERTEPVDAALIDRVFNDTMTGLRGHPELSHMEERLRLVLSKDKFVMALELLTEASLSDEMTHETAVKICSRFCKEGEARKMMNDVTSILKHDGYIKISESGNLVFESYLLKNWWRKRFGYGYAKIGD